MKSHHHTRMLALFAYSVLAVVAGLYCYVRYVVMSSTSAVVTEQAEVQNDLLKYDRDARLAVTYRANSAEWDRLAGFFIPGDATVKFIEAVESIGDQSGASVTLSSINADDLTGAALGTTGSIKARVDVRGSWTEVMRTLLLAENMPYRASLGNIKLDSMGDSKDSKGEWHLSFDVEASTYVPPTVHISTH